MPYLKINRPRLQGTKIMPAPTSYWPEDAQKLFVSISQIPLTTLSATVTIFGTSLLFFYFRSIDQPITDFTAFAGLSVVAALCALGIFAFLGLSLSLPLLVLSLFKPDQLRPNLGDGFTVWDLYAATPFSFAILFASSAIASFPKGSQTSWAVAATIFAVGCAATVYLIKRAWLHKTLGRWLFWFSLLFAYGVMSLIPLITLYAFRSLFAGLGLYAELVIALLWLLILLVNATTKIENRFTLGLVIFSVLTGLIFVWMPSVTGKSKMLPEAVAMVVGIRGWGPETLGVPRTACLLLQKAALDEGLRPPNEKCDHDNWNTVEGTVLSNVGSNWMLEFPLSRIAGTSGEWVNFRVSIPSAGIQKSNARK